MAFPWIARINLIQCGELHANGAKRRSLANTLSSIGKHIAITKRAMIVASYIADSVDTASKVNAELQILHIMQFAKQMSANEGLQSNRAVAAMHHAFITKVK